MIIINYEKCTGCGACINACAVKAITPEQSQEGFLYPSINSKLCVNCNMCDRVCPIDKNMSKVDQQGIFLAINKNNEDIEISSSGGIFIALAKQIIEQDGCVFGCAFDDQMVARHRIVQDTEELRLLCGSKYVQSDVGLSYRLVRETLNQGKQVLFSGTPCQIDGLRSFLGKEYSNLYLVDIICHGVSSPLLLSLHINRLEKRRHSKLKSMAFRSKQKGWGLYYYYSYLNGKNDFGESIQDAYFTDFLKGRNYRNCCYQCQYANTNRVGDITLGDFWGANNYFENIDISKGASLVLVNTDKGNALFNSIMHGISLHSAKIEWAIKGNQNLEHPTKINPLRTNYYTEVFKGINRWEMKQRYCKQSIKIKIYSIVPESLKSKWRIKKNGNNKPRD